MMKNTTKGQITIHMLLTVAALVAAIAAPIVWAGQINSANAVQDIKISALQDNYLKLETKIEETNAGINALLIEHGINPTTLKAK